MSQDLLQSSFKEISVFVLGEDFLALQYELCSMCKSHLPPFEGKANLRNLQIEDRSRMLKLASKKW